MNTEFEKLLVEALEITSETATTAWWHNRTDHCGSDFHHLVCKPCFAYDQCTRNEKLAHIITELKAAVG